MSAQREELLRLVEELPETGVAAVLDAVCRRFRGVKNKPWPPAWFGAGEGNTPDVAARSEELLDDGFAVRRDGLRHCQLMAATLSSYSSSFVSSSRLLTLAKIRSWATKHFLIGIT